MYSEHECGICYQIYNAGRRCPRELQCKHTFCESCLLALCGPQGPGEPGRSIVCPLCRHVTSIPGEERIRAALRVDECVLERMVAAGVLDREGDPAEEGEDGEVRGDRDESPAGEEGEEDESSSSPPGSRRGRLRRSLRRVWGKISGRDAQQRGGEMCMTNDDLRNIVMMTCNMF